MDQKRRNILDKYLTTTTTTTTKTAFIRIFFWRNGHNLEQEG